MPSKVVYIKRNIPFVHGQIKSEAAMEELSHSRKSIGSYYFSSTSSRKGSGLTEEEIELLLPLILDVSAKDSDFKKSVDKFYTEINTRISSGDKGQQFEIGLTLDNTKPITYKEEKDGRVVYNLPLNVEDYIRFRHGKSHPKTAPDPEAGKGNKHLWFYIEDPELVLSSRMDQTEIADEAMKQYMLIKEDKDKMKMIITLMRTLLPKQQPGEAPRVIELMDDRTIAMTVRNHLVVNRPSDFIRVATDENLSRKYVVDELINVGLLKRIGTTIFISESDEPIGNTLGEAVGVLWSPERSQLLAAFKLQYDQKKKERTERQIVRGS